MFNVILAATAILSIADPSGDMLGDGTYNLPTSMSNSEISSLDLRQTTIYDDNNKLAFELGFSALPNPLNAPNGFSAPAIDIFIKTRVGGAETLGTTGFNTPASMGWQYHLKLTGFSTILERVPSSSVIERMSTQGVKVTTKGASVHVTTPLPTGDYQYWVMVSLFDPLSPDGVGRIQSELSPVQVSTTLNNPPQPLDILSSNDQSTMYLSRVYSPVGELVDIRPWILLGLGVLGLLLGIAGSVRIWNERKNPF